MPLRGLLFFFDYELAEKSLGYLCTERDFWGVYRGMLGDSRMQKPRAGVAVHLHVFLPINPQNRYKGLSLNTHFYFALYLYFVGL